MSKVISHSKSVAELGPRMKLPAFKTHGSSIVWWLEQYPSFRWIYRTAIQDRSTKRLTGKFHCARRFPCPLPLTLYSYLKDAALRSRQNRVREKVKETWDSGFTILNLQPMESQLHPDKHSCTVCDTADMSVVPHSAVLYTAR